MPMSETPSSWVRDVTTADFERDVLQASHERPVVVDFWAPWCGPCRTLGPMLEHLIAERQGEVILAKVNVDDEQSLAAQFQIGSIPTVLAFRGGRIVREFTGLLPEAHLRAFLDEISPGPADRMGAEARQLETTDPAAAEPLYRKVVEQDRDNMEARIGLARVLLAQGKTDEVEAVLEPVGPEGELGAEAQRLGARLYFQQHAREFGDEAAARKRLATNPESAQARLELGNVLALGGDYPAALEMLLSAAERDPKLAAGKVREAMVQVFYLLGAGHPLANEYRAKLTRVLY